jgi:hypothetical protein
VIGESCKALSGIHIVDKAFNCWCKQKIFCNLKLVIRTLLGFQESSIKGVAWLGKGKIQRGMGARGRKIREGGFNLKKSMQ